MSVSHKLILSVAALLSVAPVFAAPQGQTLDDAFKAARVQSADLAASRAGIDALDAKTHSVESQNRLKVSASTSATGGSMGGIIASAPGVDPAALTSAERGGWADQNITAMLPISTGGRVNAERDSARYGVLSARFRLDADKAALWADIASAYVDAILNARLVDSAQTGLDAETEQARVVSQRVNEGKSAVVDGLTEEAQLASMRQALAEAKGAAAASLSALKTLEYADQSSDLILTDSLDSLNSRISVPNGTLTQLIALASSQRGELRSAGADALSADAGARMAKSAYRPQISGFLMADLSGKLDGSQSSPDSGYLVGVVLSIPVIDGGLRKADIDQAKSQSRAAQLAASSVKNKIAGEVAAAFAALAPSEDASGGAGSISKGLRSCRTQIREWKINIIGSPRRLRPAQSSSILAASGARLVLEGENSADESD
jgi:outer membrane protein TolC